MPTANDPRTGAEVRSKRLTMPAPRTIPPKPKHEVMTDMASIRGFKFVWFTSNFDCKQDCYGQRDAEAEENPTPGKGSNKETKGWVQWLAQT